MSKKKKFKKKLKAQIFQQMQSVSAEPQKSAEIIVEKKAEIISQKPTVDANHVPAINSEPKLQTNEFAYVSADLKKTGIVFAVCLVILLAIYYLGLKTSYIADISNWLATALHISS
ncbi:MAG: hypothetical protein M1338_05165 [Patescibacteria group bacterium]|nr:hypothetical protein [Patescibacteria group bacterium]